MLATQTTIDQFDKLDLPDDQEWELQEGQVVGVTFPSVTYRDLQERLTEILKRLFPEQHVLTEYPFQIVETLDKRSADVGVVESGRAQEAKVQDILSGAPDFVIEVLSPSDSVKKLKAYRRLCFQHGTKLFWVVDPDDSTIEVYTAAMQADQIWEGSGEISIQMFGTEVKLFVHSVFSGITL